MIIDWLFRFVIFNFKYLINHFIELIFHFIVLIIQLYPGDFIHYQYP